MLTTALVLEMAPKTPTVSHQSGGRQACEGPGVNRRALGRASDGGASNLRRCYVALIFVTRGWGGDGVAWPLTSSLGQRVMTELCDGCAEAPRWIQGPGATFGTGPAS